RVERILPDGGLSGSAESHVNAAALSKDQSASVAGKHALLCCGEFGILLDCRLDLVSIHRRSSFFAQALRINVACVNTLRDQEVLGAVHAAIRETLVVLGAAARIGMALQDQVSIGLELQILLEILSQSCKRGFLAGEQSAVRVLFRGQRRLE